MRFERAGLFKVVKEYFDCNEALYPGSLIHVTPSFFLPHVVYVDHNPLAVEFFGDLDSVIELVNRNKQYKRSAFVRFIAQDFAASLPLMESQFDLLISLYAGNIFRHCKKYLKHGGLFLTNIFQDNVLEALEDAEFQLVSVVRYRRQRYTLAENDLEEISSSYGKARVKKYLKQASTGIEYLENEDYLIFRRGMLNGKHYPSPNNLIIGGRDSAE
jgi:SAM-dependent methyltransferase